MKIFFRDGVKLYMTLACCLDMNLIPVLKQLLLRETLWFQNFSTNDMFDLLGVTLSPHAILPFHLKIPILSIVT